MSHHDAGITSAPEVAYGHSTRLEELDKNDMIKEDVAVTTSDANVAFDLKAGAAQSVGLALIEQTNVIPTTGARKVTTQWEYWTYCAFYFGANGAPIALTGAAQFQLLASLQFPDGIVKWGGTSLPLNSMILDLTGIIFAIQLVSLLFIGAYADYGNWRGWIMIGFMGLLYICQFGMCGFIKPDQWEGAQALYIPGIYAMNMIIAFYAAAFPGIVQDLPRVISSEQEVLNGSKSPEVHDDLVSYERSRLNNLLNVIGSSLQIVSSAAALGIAAAIGYATDADLLYSYRVLGGFLAAFCVFATVPYFLAQKHRPGMQIPEGTSLLMAGPKQVWSALRSIRQLKQCLLYLIAYFLLQETYGTYYSVVGILQNEVVLYSPEMLNALNIVGSVAGGGGNLFVYLMQKRYRFSTKKGVFYGACMTLLPNLWGAIGSKTNVIGFHHVWEFWLAEAWNFQMAPWASYQIAFMSEVVPTPKSYLFFALFNTVGRTSGFVGPFISSAIITRANGNTNMAFWFLFGMGSVGLAILYFVDSDKAKLDNAKYLEREANELYSEDQRLEAAENVMELKATHI